MKSFTGWNRVERMGLRVGKEMDGREGRETSQSTQVEGGRWGGDPGCLLKRLRRGGASLFMW